MPGQGSKSSCIQWLVLSFLLCVLFVECLYFSVLKLLLENGGVVDRVDQSSWTPLHWAACNGHRDCCLLLLDWNADISSTTNVCQTYFVSYILKHIKFN